MNEFKFFQDEILRYLYKKGTVSTDKIENLFGSDNDVQNVNNVICNRANRTSYIYKGYMEYDEENRTLSITKKGKNFVENNYR